jgi:hypothetical protein
MSEPDWREVMRQHARFVEAHAWIKAFGDATPPERIAVEVAELRAR